MEDKSMGKMLNKKEPKFILSHKYEDWGKKQKEKIHTLSLKKYDISIKQLGIIDECIKTGDWSQYFVEDEKIKKIEGSIRKIEREMRLKLSYAHMIWDLATRYHYRYNEDTGSVDYVEPSKEEKKFIKNFPELALVFKMIGS